MAEKTQNASYETQTQSVDARTPNIGIPFFLHQSQVPAGEIKFRHLVASTALALGDLVYGYGDNNFRRLAITNNAALTSVAGVPTWTAGYSGTITLAKITAGGANGSITVVRGIITAVVAPT